MFLDKMCVRVIKCLLHFVTQTHQHTYSVSDVINSLGCFAGSTSYVMQYLEGGWYK